MSRDPSYLHILGAGDALTLERLKKAAFAGLAPGASLRFTRHTYLRGRFTLVHEATRGGAMTRSIATLHAVPVSAVRALPSPPSISAPPGDWSCAFEVSQGAGPGEGALAALIAGLEGVREVRLIVGSAPAR